MFFVGPADAQPGDETSAGEHVESGQTLSELYRAVVPGNQDAAPDQRPPGARRDECHELGGPEHRTVGGVHRRGVPATVDRRVLLGVEEVFLRPQSGESELLGGHREVADGRGIDVLAELGEGEPDRRAAGAVSHRHQRIVTDPVLPSTSIIAPSGMRAVAS